MSGLIPLIVLCAASNTGDVLDSAPYWLDTRRACGPLCLSFLDKYYGGTSSYTEIAKQSPPGPGGTNLSKLSEVAEQLGYYTLGFESNTENLKRLKWPAIIHLNARDLTPKPGTVPTTHFVVVHGWNETKGQFAVFDPPSKYINVTEEWISDRFSGAGLIVSNEPIGSFEQAFKPGSIWSSWLPELFTLVFASSALIWIGWRPKRNKSRVLATASLLLLLCGCAAEAPNENPYHVDKGEVRPGTTIYHTFKVVNTQNEPVRYTDFVGSCTCTNTLLGGMPLLVKPGEFAEAKVEVPIEKNSKDQRLLRTFYLTTDSKDPEFRKITLLLNADVRGLVSPIPQRIMFGNLSTKPDVSKQLTVIEREPGVLKTFQSVSTDHSGVVVKREESSADLLLFNVTLGDHLSAGLLSANIILTFDNDDIQDVKIPVLAQIKSDFKTIPSKLVVRSGAGEYKMRVSSLSDKPVKVLKYDCPEGVSLEVKEDNPTICSLKISVSQEHLAMLPSAITLHLDHPDEQELRIPITRPK
ncbi:cysteine peptidase family C39 domain-containing protein [Gimesia aquarii]|uniref:Peptidase C39 family protein n=1 Tax=Gimesia aquarii TaxID=2527964 RepID=A0A517WU36_9PLAN|nr:cysteine peptidase family C39 domain-containing protein [Gimesia aquarii]QDU08742.1 Peptidase C39 family protein [Gimesia aquarii]